MKKLITLFFILLTFLSFSQTLPKSKGYVSDYDNVFTPEQNAQLTKILTDYEAETSIEIAVLTVSDFESDIADFSQKTAESWGIGKKDVDNGLLIVVSKTKKLIWCSTGYGLEGYLPDGWLKGIQDSVTKAYPGKYFEGTLDVIDKVKNKIGYEYSQDTNKELIKKNEEGKEESIIGWMIDNVPWYVWIIIIVLWIILFIFSPDLALQLLFLGLMRGGGGKSGGFGGGKFGGGGSGSKW